MDKVYYTGADGSYSLCGLITGDYYVRIDYCYADMWYQDADPNEGDPLRFMQ